MKILVTSALPYANGPLHFGHIAGAYLPGDCYARFQRLKGNDVLYLCGSDEYGVAITLSAELAKRTPKEHVDHFHAINQAFFEKLEFSFDHFGRTTWSGHIPTTQEFFLALDKKGLIEERRVEQLYSEQEGRFLADRYVVGTCPKCGFEEARGDECQRCASSYEATDLKNPRSKLTGSPLILKETDHFYLLFDKFKEKLAEWIKTKQWKENVLHFAMRYVEDLKPRAITRDSKWGVPVPGLKEPVAKLQFGPKSALALPDSDFSKIAYTDSHMVDSRKTEPALRSSNLDHKASLATGSKDKVFYVWFDAPIGYVSIAKEWAEKTGKRWEDYWLDPKTKLVHFLGKDNIPFHAVFFPAMLMGQDLPYKLPDELPANEFFLLEGRQFSKSDGWFIDLDSFFAKYTPDQARYAIAANAPETSDAEFSWKDFQMRCNAELLGKFGNFVHRVLTFAKQHCQSQVPENPDPDSKFLHQIDLLMEIAAQSYDGFHLRKATHALMELATAGNTYFDAKKPWLLAKDPEKKQELQTTLACCIECIKNLALLASPILPASAQKIWHMLGYTTELAKESWDAIRSSPVPPKQKLQEPQVLFRKVEDAEIEEEIAKLGRAKSLHKESPMTEQTLKAQITFDDFEKLDLRIGQVCEAEKIPKSKKLLKLLVDLGSEKRTIVSGIALSYTPDQLIGKKLIVVANLAPTTIMGVESQGMVLAATAAPDLELPQIQNLPAGTVVS